jgi:EpsI family protein
MGRTLYGRLLLPLLYLFFLVPSGTFLIPALQDFTARFAVSGLHVLNIPVFSSGAVIEIPAGTFAVAEACAGVRFLITSVAFGVFYSALTYRSYTRRIVFMVLSIVVPLIANGLRVLGLLAAAEWVGSPTAVLADHIIYGWVFFSFVLLTLILIGRTFSDQIPEPASPATKTWASFLSNLDTRRTAFAAVACCAAAVCGPIAAAFASDVRPMTLPDAGPQVSAPWFKATGETDWTPKVVGPSRTFADTFEDGRNRIDRFVAVYALQKGDQTLIHSDNRAADERMWSFNSRSDANLSVDGQTFQLQGSTWLRGTQQREVWSFYVVDGVPVSSLWAAKWHQIYGRLSASRCLTGYVALSVESTAGVPSQVPIQEFLNDSQRLRTYFCPS